MAAPVCKTRTAVLYHQSGSAMNGSGHLWPGPAPYMTAIMVASCTNLDIRSSSIKLRFRRPFRIAGLPPFPDAPPSEAVTGIRAENPSDP